MDSKLINQPNDRTSVHDDEIDLFELWNGLVEEKTLIISLFLLSLGFAFAFIWQSPSIYQATAKLQVQQVQQVQQTKGEIAPYSSIEPATKTAELLSGTAPASITAVKAVNGVLIVSSSGSDKIKIEQNVVDTIQMIQKRHLKIFTQLKQSGSIEILPTEIIGSVQVTSEPIKPKKSLILAVAGVLGLMLGVFIALIRRAVKNRRQADEVTV